MVRSLAGNVGKYKRERRAALRVALPATPESEMRISQVAAGNNHSIAVTEQGVVFGWGCNLGGQIGASCTGTSCTGPVSIGPSVRISQVAAGLFHTVLLACDG